MSTAITGGFERMRIQQILLLPLVLTVAVLAQDQRVPPFAERLAAFGLLAPQDGGERMIDRR